ncbi:hypothetical protein [Reyranella sp. CPCC 100927]|uniref:hypothetical protein n=1 Tax=Reyranella sp. CPCC 100927 TaxID=2599616 RepID=UPI0011B5097F|nr:hypothetical protein [Reyranella sp. CPCC 100927]TWT11542.1 hypothetical protein FQU96_13775 [Reyranella sp. CPCC 100927]
MKEPPMRKWQPPAELRRLLDTLDAEIQAATDDDVQQAYRGAGRSLSASVRDVRRLIATATSGLDDPEPAIPPTDALCRREAWLRQH